MDDDTQKQGGNQSQSVVDFTRDKPQPIFETVASEPPPKKEPEPAQNVLAPEEVAENVETPEEGLVAPAPFTPPPPAPPLGPEHLIRYGAIGAAVVFFILIFFVILKLFSGGITPAQPITLQYWGLWEEKEIYDPLIVSYQSKHPNVKIVYQKMSPQDYRAKLLARSANGQGPDIFRFHNTWLPEIKDVAAVLPSSVMTNSEFEKTFYPIHASDLGLGPKNDKHYYGIPLEIDGLVLIYNNGLFKKAGITTAPVTWKDITDDIQKLEVKGPDGTINVAAIAIGLASNVDHYSDIFGLMLVQNGGDLSKLDTTEGAGTLQAFREFAEPPNSFWNDSMPASVVAFTQGKVAMIIAPSWQIQTIKAQNPDIELKVTAVPSLPGTQPIDIASYWAEGVSVHSKNQLESWKFLKFLSEKDNMTKLYELEAKSRLFGEPYSRVDLAPSLAQNPHVGVIIQQAKNFVSFPLISTTYDNGLNDEIVQNIQNAINAAVTGTSYDQALVAPAEGIRQVMKRFKI